MAITYTWNVKNVETIPAVDSNTNVIYRVHWRLKGTDDDGTWAESNDIARLDTSNIENFIELSSVTEENVQAWVEAHLGEDEIQRVKGFISDKIELERNPYSTRTTIG